MTHPADMMPPSEAKPVAWRWRAKGSIEWVYDPDLDWLMRQDDDHVDREPLYSQSDFDAMQARAADLSRENAELKAEAERMRKEAPVAVTKAISAEFLRRSKNAEDLFCMTVTPSEVFRSAAKAVDEMTEIAARALSPSVQEGID